MWLSFFKNCSVFSKITQFFLKIAIFFSKMSKNWLNLTRTALLNTKKTLKLHSSTWFYLRNPFLHSFMIDCLRLTQFSGENSLSFSIKLSFSSWVFSEGSVFWAEFFCWRTKKKPGLNPFVGQNGEEDDSKEPTLRISAHLCPLHFICAIGGQ